MNLPGMEPLSRPPLDLVAGRWRWRLDPSRILSIGREGGCDVRVDHGEVSRRHAEIYFDPASGWVLRDLGSANGIYVHGQRVRGVHLEPNIPVALGPSPSSPTLTVEAAGGQPPSAYTAGGSKRRETVVASEGTKKPVTIGRAPDNTFVVDDFLVSRHHVRATWMHDAFWIEDLGSLNGTYVNGAAVDRARVGPEDRMTVGAMDFRVDNGELKMSPQRLEVSLVASNLQVQLPDGKQILGGVGFALPEASLLAVIGPSGAGKSTLLKALTGAKKATAGQVLFDGRDLYENYSELRNRIGVVPQEDVVHPQLTVRQALGYASELRFPADLDASARLARIEEVAIELGLEQHMETRIDRLSGGQRKRTSVALELLTHPSLLFLDEPTSGLDPGLDKSVMQTLRTLADGGRTVVVITHSVANLGLCDRVLLLAPGGRIAYFGPPDQVLSYFGQSDYSDVFSIVAAEPDRVVAEFQRHSSLNNPGPMIPSLRAADDVAAPRRQQPMVAQAWTLVRRHLRVMVSDRSYAVFMAALPAVLAILVTTVPGSAGFGRPSVPPTSEPGQLLVVLIVGAAFMGVASSSRDLVGERAIFRRERAVGLSPGAYLVAKLFVFGGLAAVQSAVVTGLVLLLKAHPDSASALGNGSLELWIAVAATSFCSAVLGLLISAIVSTSEQVMPLLVISIMAQLVLCGGLIPVMDRAGLEQVSWIAPSRWGYAAAASTSALLAKVPGASDPLWKHAASSWWTCLAMLAVLVVLFGGLTARRLFTDSSNR